MDPAAKTRLDDVKTNSKKVVHKAAEATGEFTDKIADKIVIPKLVPDENAKNVKEIVIPPEKREEILNKLRQVS